ncbi:hypothetical protein C8F01DRAFT_1140283 [Mycena amicta]|nr:hypothetical protein C8F01DRAFT_1140283 [Mycena amicta]
MRVGSTEGMGGVSKEGPCASCIWRWPTFPGRECRFLRCGRRAVTAGLDGRWRWWEKRENGWSWRWREVVRGGARVWCVSALYFGRLPTFPAHNIVGGGRFTMRTASGRPVPTRGRKWKGEGLWVHGNEVARMEVRVSCWFFQLDQKSSESASFWEQNGSIRVVDSLVRGWRHGGKGVLGAIRVY